MQRIYVLIYYIYKFLATAWVSSAFEGVYRSIHNIGVAVHTIHYAYMASDRQVKRNSVWRVAVHSGDMSYCCIEMGFDFDSVSVPNI